MSEQESRDIPNGFQLAEGTRYLAFSLGEEQFAIPLLVVKEVIAVPELTSVPYTPRHFLGIMNLRGQVISVIDLRTKFGIQPNDSSETAVIICDLSSLVLGAMVDSVNSVLTPKSHELSQKPEIESTQATEYIQAIYRNGDALVLLLDIAKALNAADRQSISKLTQASQAA